MPQTPIGPKDTLGDIYYKTYTEEARGDALHQPVWGLKQKDTFIEFPPYRDRFLNPFPPGDVNRQRAQTHDGLYHAYIVGEANTRAANHQIVKDFEKLKSAFTEEKAAFDAEKKSEEWGRERLKSKLRAAEELLSKERAEWKEVCKKDNQRMYATRSKINDLEAQIATLKKKVEDVEGDKEHVEAELKAQVASKDKDLKAKDNEIAELKHRLHEAIDKNESLEIDLEAERVKAATAEEAKQRADEA
ncbi:putative intermediate filament, rod domain, coil 1B [Helianthus anomalus]